MTAEQLGWEQLHRFADLGQGVLQSPVGAAVRFGQHSEGGFVQLAREGERVSVTVDMAGKVMVGG